MSDGDRGAEGRRMQVYICLAVLLCCLFEFGCCRPCQCPTCPVIPAVPTRDAVQQPPPTPVEVLIEQGTESEPGKTPQSEPIPAPPVPAGVPGEPTTINGLVVPYPLDKPLRGYGKCRRGKRRHPAFDIGGVGANGGLGTPVVSMARAKITMIGRGEDDPAKFGRPDKRSGMVKRGSRTYPRSAKVEGYGRVYFFTRNFGSWRSGTIISTMVMDGRYRGYKIRYMHLGEVHPSLVVGDIVEAGQEIGIMGGTAVQESCPHVHVDMTDLEERRVDVKALLGLDEPHGSCP
jgi:murein DD-endopeptidase MepM/ murein hydrolase activator NlpD